MTRRHDEKLEALDDEALVRLCVDGDEAALTALVVRYRRLVYAIPFRYGFRAEGAADVFQSVWLRFIEKLPTIQDPRRIAGWLATTTVRECWRASERARREPPIGEGGDAEVAPMRHEPVDLRPLADEEQVMLELQHRVRTAVELLPERCRLLLELLFYEDEPASYAEISRRLGMPADSIGPTRARCLAKLRQLMQEPARGSGDRDE